MEKEYKKVSYQEKMDALVNAVKEDPNVSISQYPGYYEDGSAKANFWNISSNIVKNCSKKEKLTEQELYIVMSHAIIDDLKGKYTTMSRKDKIDYIYDLVLKDPSMVFSKCKLHFADGTQVIGFWNTIQTEIRKNREKNLTEEENYIYYTSACIEDLKRDYTFHTLISKFEELYAYVLQDENHSVYNKKKQFPDGTYYVHFWDWLQTFIQKCRGKEKLTEQELITLYYGAKIDEVLENRQKKSLSVLEKAYYLLEYAKMHPLENLYLSQELFPDGTSLSAFSHNMHRFYKSILNKPVLSETEQKIIRIYFEIKEVHTLAKLEAQASRVRKLIQ